MKCIVTLESSVYTHKGLIRLNNEDNFYFNGTYMNQRDYNTNIKISLSESNEEYIYAVCDGMGGEEAGEIASLTAVSTLKKYHDEKINFHHYENIDQFAKLLNEFVSDANNCISNMSLQNGVNMGTTFTCLGIFGDKAVVLNVGDSRVYHYANGLLKQLTVDHTEAERLIRLGILTREQARHHKSRHLLSRHLGVSPDAGIMTADIFDPITLTEGDIFILCSDGLVDMVADKRIEEIITSEKTCDVVSSALMAEALKNGGVDNITCMIIKIEQIEFIS